MKKAKILVCLPLLLILLQCDKDEALIKQLRIELGGCQTSGSSISTSSYKNFNKNNYSGLKSIIFMAHISTSYNRSTCCVNLYNLKDSIDIENSALTTTSESSEWLESGNLLEYFPDGDFDLALHVTSEYSYYSAYVNTAYLYLYME
jgi:hypothetical protein